MALLGRFARSSRIEAACACAGDVPAAAGALGESEGVRGAHDRIALRSPDHFAQPRTKALAIRHPIATVDVALFSLREGALCVLLSRRPRSPFAGALALPGGFVRTAQDVDTAATARRVICEKTAATVTHLEQLYTFSGRARDPRGWSISVAYYALVPEGDVGLEEEEGAWLAPVSSLPALPFDHTSIVEAAVRRLRDKSAYSSLPTYLLAPQFTLAELQRVYEQVMGTALDRTTFRRNLLAQGVIEPVEGVVRGGAHRPAQVYRRAQAELQAFDRTLS